VKKMSEKKWRALDDYCCGNSAPNADVTQNGGQSASTSQQTYEWIVVKDSEGVTVTKTDNQAAASLQAALEAAIAVVISITVASSDAGKAVAQELKQMFKSRQRINKKLMVLGSRDVEVTTTDNQLVVNIQVLVELLATLVAKLQIG
jgi:spore coat protein X